jgi:ADP-ribose pyrophosphatase
MGNTFQFCGASVIIYKDNKILLQQRKDNKCWGYHGGRVEIGEKVEDAAKRELLEETGLTANSLEFFGVFSGPEVHHTYPDGNKAYIIDIVFLCNDFSGEPLYQEEECLDLQWFEINNIPENISPPIMPALNKFIAQINM